MPASAPSALNLALWALAKAQSACKLFDATHGWPRFLRGLKLLCMSAYA